MANRRSNFNFGRPIYRVGESDEQFADFFVNPHEHAFIGHIARLDPKSNLPIVTLYNWGFNLFVANPTERGFFRPKPGQCISVGYELEEKYAESIDRYAPTVKMFELYNCFFILHGFCGFDGLRSEAGSRLIKIICEKFNNKEGKSLGINIKDLGDILEKESPW